MDHSYFNYFTEIEEYFVRRRGKHMLISPLDWSLIESWKQTGIPLHVVFRGIDRAFERHQTRKTQKLVNSIFYCQQSVMGSYDEYLQARVGESTDAEREGAADEKVLQAVRDLRVRLGKAAPAFTARESIERAKRMLGELEEEIAPGKSPSLVRVENTLQACDFILLEAARRLIEPSALEQFEKEARKELRIYKKKVTPEMYSRIEQNVMNRKLRAHFDLPEFTLFFLG
ncbi:MAG TPA: hypothetical protein VGK99_11585 [Acidobacteriota bacterium]